MFIIVHSYVFWLFIQSVFADATYYVFLQVIASNININLNKCDCNYAGVNIISMSRFACLNAVLITRFLTVNIKMHDLIYHVYLCISKTVIIQFIIYIHTLDILLYIAYTTFWLCETGPYTTGKRCPLGAGFGVPPRDSPSFTGWIWWDLVLVASGAVVRSGSLDT